MRKVFLALLVGGLTLFSTVVVAIGGAAAAACPNEALRVGPSALLPECRAYEQVTPVAKEGGTGIFLNGVVQAATSGEGVSFISPSAYASPQGSPLGNRYASFRSGGEWTTEGIDGPQAIQELLLIRATFALSQNLEYALTASKEAIAPGAIQGGSNLYLRDLATGATTLIAAESGNSFFFEMTGTLGRPFVGASTDWSRLLLFSAKALAPGAEAGRPNLYEYAGGRLKLALPPGAEPAARTSTAQTPFVMSADGNRFFFTREEVLYMREGGTRTVPISESKVIPEGEEGHLASATFVGASPEGSTVIFISGGDLTGESAGNAIYRYRTTAGGGSELTDLTPDSINLEPGVEPSEVVQALAMAEDGEYVYFNSRARLTADAPAVEEESTNLYVWHGAPGEAGTVRYIAQTDPHNGAERGIPPQYSASADGRYFAIGSRSPLTPAAAPASPACLGAPTEGVPAERCINVFAYSYPAGTLSCLSCTGGPSPGDSTLGGQRSKEEVFTYVPRSVLDDGTVFFDTAASLVPRDTNGVGDVYEGRAGQFELLSTGTGDTASSFGDSTADGHDVFIRSGQQLVGQDDDSALDVYDVRVDGGIAAQAGVTPPAQCSSEANCRTGIAGPPTAPTPSSSKLEGSGNVAGRCRNTKHLAKVAKRRAASLKRRVAKTEGKRGAALSRRATAEGKKAAHLAKQAQICTKGAAR